MTKNTSTDTVLSWFDQKRVFRKVKETGLWTISRSIDSCIFASSFCRKHCYAILSTTQVWPNQKKEIQRLQEIFWKGLTGDILQQIIARKRSKINYIRFAGSGECITSLEDVLKVQDIVISNPNIKFWLPTRSWVDPDLCEQVENKLFPLDNLSVQASTDIETTRNQFGYLFSIGWNITFFGADVFPFSLGYSDYLKKCPKTWEYKDNQRNVCIHCLNCFNKIGNVGSIVHYRQTQIRRSYNNYQKFVAESKIQTK